MCQYSSVQRSPISERALFLEGSQASPICPGNSNMYRFIFLRQIKLSNCDLSGSAIFPENTSQTARFFLGGGMKST
jgi:hypothetical protein